MREPWLQDPDVTLYHGDVLDVLREMPDESVDCVVTSPPYFGLRDYGSPGQLGLEKTVEEHVEAMTRVFSELNRVLASHGTLWLNYGDSYGSGVRTQMRSPSNEGKHGYWSNPAINQRIPGTPAKQLLGVPWRMAFALQADGWYLRSDIIWSKPNPMPESVTDRPTKAHEYVFLLSKQPRYFFDQEAVREKSLRAGDIPGGNNGRGVGEFGVVPHAPFNGPVPANRNIRSVWEIATQPYPEAHFATFPEELARRAIAAGCPESVCRVCGKARERITETIGVGRSEKGPKTEAKRAQGLVTQFTRAPGGATHPQVTTLGFTDCGHADFRPGRVLDPFMGSGTTAFVARKLGRHSVGIDLSAEYLELAAKRTAQQSLLTEVA